MTAPVDSRPPNAPPPPDLNPTCASCGNEIVVTPHFCRAKEKGYWGLAILVCFVLFVFIALVSFLGNWHWADNLWFNYSWPSDKGNGPEALQQTVVYALAAAVFIPVVRHFIAKEFAKVHHSIHIHGTELTAHLHHITRQVGGPPFEHSPEYKEHIANHVEPK